MSHLLSIKKIEFINFQIFQAYSIPKNIPKKIKYFELIILLKIFISTPRITRVSI